MAATWMSRPSRLRNTSKSKASLQNDRFLSTGSSERFYISSFPEHTAAILKDWKLSFMPGIPLTEPGYANLAQSPGSEVHGVAFLMSKESQEELDRTERSYAKVFVDLTSYDGRPLKGFVYYNAKASGEGVPSTRYLGVLVKGVRNSISGAPALLTSCLHFLPRSETGKTE